MSQFTRRLTRHSSVGNLNTAAAELGKPPLPLRQRERVSSEASSKRSAANKNKSAVTGNNKTSVEKDSSAKAVVETPESSIMPETHGTPPPSEVASNSGQINGVQATTDEVLRQAMLRMAHREDIGDAAKLKIDKFDRATHTPHVWFQYFETEVSDRNLSIAQILTIFRNSITDADVKDWAISLPAADKESLVTLKKAFLKDWGLSAKELHKAKRELHSLEQGSLTARDFCNLVQRKVRLAYQISPQNRLEGEAAKMAEEIILQGLHDSVSTHLYLNKVTGLPQVIENACLADNNKPNDLAQTVEMSVNSASSKFEHIVDSRLAGVQSALAVMTERNQQLQNEVMAITTYKSARAQSPGPFSRSKSPKRVSFQGKETGAPSTSYSNSRPTYESSDQHYNFQPTQGTPSQTPFQNYQNNQQGWQNKTPQPTQFQSNQSNEPNPWGLVNKLINLQTGNNRGRGRGQFRNNFRRGGQRGRQNQQFQNSYRNSDFFNGECYYCQKFGHRARECRQRQNNDKSVNGPQASVNSISQPGPNNFMFNQCQICGMNHTALQCPHFNNK